MELLKFLLIYIPVFIGVAFLTLLERKLLSSVQKRVGPNVVGFLGILQPIADAAKLIFKELVLPNSSNKLIFMFSSLLSFSLSLISWIFIPLNEDLYVTNYNHTLLFIFAFSSLNVYSIIMAGWSSNSRYAFLGALRSASQMISYEVSIGLIILNISLCTGSLNILDIVLFQENIWFLFPLFPSFILFLISAVAETNRAPFDLPEAEGELVAGYNVEYSSSAFALFFIAEYANILLMSTITVLLFLGGWLPFSHIFLNFLDFLLVPWFLLPFFTLSFLPNSIWFFLKLFFILNFFIWIRATFPRYRYDQLMRLGWKVILPLSLANFVFTSFILFFFGFYPSLN